MCLPFYVIEVFHVKTALTLLFTDYTAQKYFDDIRESRFPDAPTNIAIACLTYLSLDVFAEGHCLSYGIFENRLRENPFFDYATRHWGDHIRGNTDQGVQNLALDFLMDNSKASSSGQAFLISDSPQYAHYLFPKESSGIHLAAHFDLRDIVKLLLEKGADLNSKDNPYNRTPLSWAAEEGHETVVKLLLAKDGVDPDAKDKWGQTPLSWAARKGHEAVVRLLLAKDGVDPDSKDKWGWKPLARTAEKRHEAVVRLLLAKDGVDPDSKDNDWGQTPLLWAAEEGHEAVVRLLLAKDGVDPDAKANDGRTPLSWAAVMGHNAVVKLLQSRKSLSP